MADEPTNTALWLKGRGVPLEVGPAPYTSPANGEIVVKNHAWAVQIVDIGIAKLGDFIFNWVKYPFIFGGDLAGEVVEIGEGVDRFKVGDRVCALAYGTDKRSKGPTESAFQHYTIIRQQLCSQIPPSMEYKDATVIPLTLCTAASGMFMKDFCALQYPTVPPKPTGQTFIVWGGSTSVGCNAIQLAVAAGYEVFTTASPKNHELVKKLGASQAFDYRSKSVTKDIIAALKDKQCAGAIAIGNGSLDMCIDIIAAVPSPTGRKFVAQASSSGSAGIPESVGLSLVPVVFSMMKGSAVTSAKKMLKGVSAKFIFGSDLADTEVANAIFKDFLPAALANGSYVPAPEAQVVGTGLGAIEGSFEQVKGVSARKIVVLAE